MTKQRVLIVGHDVVTAVGAAQILTERGFVVWSVRAPLEVVVAGVEPDTIDAADVVVIDSTSRPTLDAVAEMRRAAKPPAVLVLTTRLSTIGIGAALDAGCLAVVPVSCSAEALEAAVRAAAAGEPYLHPTPMAMLLDDFRVRSTGKATAAAVTALSARETEVLRLVADGRSNAETAAALGIGAETAKAHVASLMRKLGARDRTHAVSIALRSGLIS